nr:hypothetical protein BDOA9_0203840 [Bradyrhizobium sp. DOA9]
MPGADGRHLTLGCPGRSRAGTAGRRARQAQDGGDQQRQRAHQPCDPDLDRSEPCRLALHRSAKPMQNGFIKRFNGRLRYELWNETLLTSFAQSRVALRCWRADNTTPGRTPSSDGRRHPRLPPPALRDGIWRCGFVEGSAPAPAATTAHMGRSNRPHELRPE